VRPKKRLSQNFLVNDRAARRIVDSLNPQQSDVILEIGSGSGALTKHLLNQVHRIVAVEIDQELCLALKEKFATNQNLTIINADILKLALGSVIKPDQHCKVAGNLPYQITSPILSFLLHNKKLIDFCVLMVQKEFALRLSSAPGSKDWSPLSVAIQLYADVKILFHLKPGSFFPQPRVNSSVIKITFLPHPRVQLEDEEWFLRVVRASFGQRRKTLLNSLASNLSLPKEKLEFILKRIEIDPQRRAETLGLKEFAVLSAELKKLV
jgi:16S rRNA (adenine1518-N6/adenine1519-N6)-dimethyltransferase